MDDGLNHEDETVVVGRGELSRPCHLDGPKPGKVGEQVPEPEGKRRIAADFVKEAPSFCPLLIFPPRQGSLLVDHDARREESGSQQEQEGDTPKREGNSLRIEERGLPALFHSRQLYHQLERNHNGKYPGRTPDNPPRRPNGGISV